jgi:hypothetical protein
MYNLKVAVTGAAPGSGSGGAGAGAHPAAPAQHPTTLPFTVGNPSVELVAGVVHLFRKVPTREEADAGLALDEGEVSFLMGRFR